MLRNSFLELQTLHHELSWSLGANRSPWSKFHQGLKSQEEIPSNSNPRASLIFNSKSTSNLKTFLWRKLFLYSNPSKPYFVSICPSMGTYLLDQSKFK
jgi:hypothetical protein